MLKPSITLFICFCLSCSMASIASDPSAAEAEYSITGKTLKYEGRGLYQKSEIAVSYDRTLVLVLPVSRWLGGMMKEHIGIMNDNLDLTDLPTLADLITEGLRNACAHFLVKIIYTLPDGTKAESELPVHEVVSTDGHMYYQLHEDVSLPTVMENVAVITESWPEPIDDSPANGQLGKKFPTHAVCCNCKGGCAALWIVFGFCKQCVAFNGGEDCCSLCNMPAAPGGSCD
ncbi:hypothetical protein [Endozoicomonas sp.]|uniref:hypothetical protein n=1 Tax=Endozoicomonas sp. TaxID=1892382 RepID=UPI00383A3B32